jgi:hypothetical protein
MQDFNSTFVSRSKFISESIKTESGRVGGHVTTEHAVGYCGECRQNVGLITIAQAAESFRTDIQDICFLLNRGKIHPAHPDRLRAFICVSSLAECFETRNTRLLDSFFEMEAARTPPRSRVLYAAASFRRARSHGACGSCAAAYRRSRNIALLVGVPWILSRWPNSLRCSKRRVTNSWPGWPDSEFTSTMVSRGG